MNDKTNVKIKKYSDLPKETRLMDDILGLLDTVNDLEQKIDKLKKQCKHRYKYASDMESKYVIENQKIKAIIKYLKDNEKEYGSLLDNEKVILKIATGDSDTIYDILKGRV